MRIRVFLFPNSMPLAVHLCLVAASALLILVCSTSCLGSKYQDCLGDRNAIPGLKFSYPFGKKGSGCGDPEFQLYSWDFKGHPLLLLDIRGNEYSILNHSFLGNNSDHKMTIVSDNLLGENCNPSRKYSDFWWPGFQFHISVDLYTNLKLWAQCNEEMPPLKHLRLCGDDWYYDIRTSEDGPMPCKRHLQLPVSKKSLQNPVDENFLLYGFEITWQVDVNRSSLCKDCSKSEGRCGYNFPESTTFLCYCPDGTSHPHNCPALHGRKDKTAIVVGCSVGGVALTAISIVLFLTYRAKRRKPSPGQGRSTDSSKYERKDMEACVPRLQIGSLSIFSYEELRQATNCFHEENELGDGGFGSVYLGKLCEGRIVAVKRLYQDSSRTVGRFINEVAIFSSLNHPHLVRLYGCTSAEGPELLLVYEFVSNGTLENHLHGDRKGPGELSWNTRLNIAIQTAHALAFLHSFNPPIFHRDVKSSNILLDENFNVKVADFGLCRHVPVNASHVTTTPQGTPGYVDPEYHQYYQLTEKSDVYSFGVVLVEIISAKLAVDINRNTREINLAGMAISKIQEGALHELVDPQLEMETNHEIKVTVSAVAELAFRCLASESNDRPHMKEVVTQLEVIIGLWSVCPSPHEPSASFPNHKPWRSFPNSGQDKRPIMNYPANASA